MRNQSRCKDSKRLDINILKSKDEPNGKILFPGFLGGEGSERKKKQNR